MRSYPFGSFERLRELAGSRRVALFGLGTVANATLSRLDSPPSLLIDNEVGLEGSRQSGVEIEGPDFLRDAAGTGLYVVICSSEVEEAARFLAGLGYEPWVDFLVSPVLAHQQPVVEIEGWRARLLFTSGAPASDAPGWGGGIYELEMDGDSFSYRKVYDGPCYSVRAIDDRFVAVDPRRGLLELDRRFKVRREAPLPLTAWCHGVAFCPDRSRYYVAATQLDTIVVLDSDFRSIGEIPLSDRVASEGRGSHHPNDLIVHRESLFVSVFSESGHWRLDVNDGAVLEVDLGSSRVRGPVVDDLWMPHNPAVVDGSLIVLDSFRGRLCRSGGRTIGQFPGFARGLANDGRFFYVGQNRNRQYHRLPEGPSCLSADTSILLFDERTKVSRSLPLPRRMTDIHSIAVLGHDDG